ncbi:bile acid:Na+ symporter, BASS family [Fontimonas thermophila]|uniref:Bile acid:Na+ symporter, BASS family n=1 Tax=Fontimonas thermophila TaxID=1076937 RepID=A0A1I2H668_9GAMM|nr:bile acid:sodium symporter family protein [Fontimonas thermophila]SFF25675.1 bile acid:Na+ symporter, BASS family [Fontimonas thermophila]
MTGIDAVELQFSPSAVLALQLILAVVIFGVALELRFGDFARLLREPRLMVIGLCSQLIALPLLTFALVAVADPAPSLALGLMMTAACPGGNMSNVLTHWAGGRTSLSMAMTTLSSLVSPVTTPLTFALLGDLHPATRAAMREVAVPYTELVGTILLALVLPLVLGMTLAQRRPALAERLRRPLKRFGVFVLLLFIVLALAANQGLFRPALVAIFWLVAAHNALALVTGWSLARLLGTGASARRAITFETGIHNTALGLTLIFSYFQGLGGMALVVAWWGVWQLVTGGLLARHWAQRPLQACVDDARGAHAAAVAETAAPPQRDRS